MADSESNQETETSSNLVNTDRRVGVEGDNARVIGEGGLAWENSGLVGGSAPVASYRDTGDIFAPNFQFGAQSPGLSEYFASQPAFQSEYQRVQASGDRRTPTQWLQDHINGNPEEANRYDEFRQQASNPVASASQFGGAVQGSGQNVGGNISAPIASGEDSQAIEAGVVAVGGDAENLVAVTAPVSAPIAGGDQQISAPVIVGNNGPVSITTSDPAVLKAALEANKEALTAAISNSGSVFDKSLAAISEANKDPEERISGNAIGAVVVVALGFAALAYYGRKAA